jgi:hypothetical protein
VLAAESRIHAAAVDAAGAHARRLGSRTWYHTPNARDPFSTNCRRDFARIPIFRGFETFEVRGREVAEAARATADRTENDVILEVWSSYYGCRPPRRACTTRDLLPSAPSRRKSRRPLPGGRRSILIF